MNDEQKLPESIDNPQAEDNEKEIDIVEILSKLWAKRITIAKWGGIAAVIGLVVAFSIPKEYSTTIKLASEGTKGASGGSISALAAMAGITSGLTSGDAVAPQLYPDVVKSTKFNVGLLDVPVTVSKDDSVYTVAQYLSEHTRSPWWSAILSLPGKAIGGVMSLFRDKPEETAEGETDPFNLTSGEAAVVGALKGRITCDYNIKTMVNTITVTMQDPLVSALLADTVAAHLKEFITDYRTSKAREDLKYAEGLNSEARENYYKAQQRYADYLDRNYGLSLHSAQIERDRLANEAQLAFNLFNQTSQQVQIAKAKVQENTPVYAIIQAATVPKNPSKPSKVMILAAFIFLGVAAASAKVIFADRVTEIRHKISGK